VQIKLGLQRAKTVVQSTPCTFVQPTPGTFVQPTPSTFVQTTTYPIVHTTSFSSVSTTSSTVQGFFDHGVVAASEYDLHPEEVLHDPTGRVIIQLLGRG